MTENRLTHKNSDSPPVSAQSNEPIKIGFSLALTGPLAPNGKQALLGAKIWLEEINAKAGLLGRKVEFVNYDDQSNPGEEPRLAAERDGAQRPLGGIVAEVRRGAIPNA